MKIALFASHNGSVLEPILQAGFDVKLIITNNLKAPVIQKAAKYDIACEVINEKIYSKRVTDVILKKLDEKGIDLIVLAGYMKMLSSTIIDRYRRKIINSHPSLLPKYGGEGMYGRFVHKAVIAAGEYESGVSVHFVEEEYDSGEIILQKRLAVDPSWNASALEAAIKRIEPAAVIEVLEKIRDERG